MDSLRNVGLKKIACGMSFSVVLGNNGMVYTFGHGKFYLNLNSFCFLSTFKKVTLAVVAFLKQLILLYNKAYIVCVLVFGCHGLCR